MEARRVVAVALTVVAYVVSTFAVQETSHFALNSDYYATLSFMRAEPIVAMGLIAMLVQGTLAGLLFPIFNRGPNTIRNALLFSWATGAFLASYILLGEGGQVRYSVNRCDASMAFDEGLAARIRATLRTRKGLAEKQMFGGLAFLVNGNMCVGVRGKEMIVRLAPDETQAALAEPHTRVFDLTGRPMKGWILVAPKGLESDAALRGWIDRATKFVSTLAAK